jgi:predicted NUDIX family phosphoesterase
MSLVQTEQVLVVPTAIFHECGHFQGFSADVDTYLKTLLDPIHTSYRPRSEMETDPSFKQLIPYCIFRHRDADGNVSIFQYTRGKGQGEARLHSKRSIGIGGHISSLDANEDSPYDQGMQRELEEEVQINTPFEQACVGMINDDETEVGKVHLGVVHIFDVAEPNVKSNETDIIESGFTPIKEILSDIESFETWSQICLRGDVL